MAEALRCTRLEPLQRETDRAEALRLSTDAADDDLESAGRLLVVGPVAETGQRYLGPLLEVICELLDLRMWILMATASLLVFILVEGIWIGTA